MKRTRIKPRHKPRRKRPELFGGHGIRLRGKAKTERRRDIFERSGGRCEQMIPLRYNTCLHFGLPIGTTERCWKRITWDSMEWSHNRHAANKCDCMECGIASCKECHARRHNPKPCPRKAA